MTRDPPAGVLTQHACPSRREAKRPPVARLVAFVGQDKRFLVRWPGLRGSMYYVDVNQNGAVTRIRTAAWDRPVNADRLARLMPSIEMAIRSASAAS